MAGTASIKLLARGDAPRLRAMLALFAEAFEDRETYLADPPEEAYLERLIASDTFVAIEAHEDDRCVGGLAGYVLPKFEQARSECYIYDLAVTATRRRQGIATAMIETLRQEAARRGIDVIFVQADPGDDAAIALYSRLGVREDVLHFDILPAPTDRTKGEDT